MFRLVQEPGGAAITRATDTSVSYVQNPNSYKSRTYAPTKSKSSKEDARRTRRAMSEEQLEKADTSDVTMNVTKAWPPRRNKSFSEEQKQARLSKYEEELTELQELKQDSVKDLRRRFDSDASGNEGTDTCEEVMSAARTPVVQRKQYARPVEQPIVPATQFLEEKTVTKVNRRESSRPSELKNIDPTLTDTVKEKEVWSPHLESSKGLVSIERVKARTLQTIPFSEDPFWKQIEEMTSFDQLMNSGEILEMANDSRPVESVAYIKQNADEEMLCTSYAQVVTTAGTTIYSQVPNTNTLPIPATRAKSFSTPEIQPLKLGTPVIKSSVDALDEVLEDIRSSLQRKPATSITIRSAPVEKESPFYSPLRSPILQPIQQIPLANIPGYQPVSMTTTTRTIIQPQQPMAAGVHGIAHSVPTYQSQRLVELQNQLGIAKQQAQAATALIQQQQQQQQQAATQQPGGQTMHYIPEYSADPYIVNGNYQLDPMILKEKLLDTGLADLSDSGSSFKGKGSSSGPGSITPTQAPLQMRTGGEAEKQVLKTVEDLTKLARDVEQRLGQIRNRMEGSDENRLDSILSALKNFAPNVEPTTTVQQPTVQLTSEYYSRKSKLQEALSELDKIYKNLNAVEHPKSVTTTVTTETKGNTIPRQSRISNETHVEYRPQIKKRNKSDSDFMTNYSAESIAEVERETQREFEDITQAFQSLLADVDRDPEFDYSEPTTPTPKDPQTHAQEIEATIESILQDFRDSGKCAGGESASFNKAIEGLTGKDVAIPNTCRDLQKSEVFTTYSGPFSVLVGINGNGKKNGKTSKSKSEKSPTALVRSSHSRPRWHTNPMHTPSAQTQTQEEDPAMEDDVNLDEVFASVLDELSEDSSEQSVESVKKLSKRGKRHMTHRKSMPAEMFKRTIETKTIETQTEVANIEPRNDQIKSKTQELIAEDSLSSEGSVDARGPQRKKIAKNIAVMMEIFSSSDDERRRSLSHSHSAPDLRELFDGDRMGFRQNINAQGKMQTPKMVKQRYEARAKKKAAQVYSRETSMDERGDDFAWTSPTSDDGSQISQGSKPPLHPKRKQKSTSPDRSILDGKSWSRKGSSNDGDGLVSDVVLRKKKRRTSSSNSQGDQERPHSFHELVAMFETNPDRLKRLTNTLRRCASADMIFMETVMRKSYHSEPDLRDSSSSALHTAQLFLEIQVQS